MNNQQDLAIILYKQEIKDVLIRYARAADQRDWPLLDRVFDPDVEANYNDEFKPSGRAEVVALMAGMLGPCGPTQHLLGNFSIEVNGSEATSRCYVRAAHSSADENEAGVYEIWGEYRSHLVRSDDRWLIDRHELWLDRETGSRDVLGIGT